MLQHRSGRRARRRRPAIGFPRSIFRATRRPPRNTSPPKRARPSSATASFLSKTDNADGTDDVGIIKMPIPHSTYLISFVIGKYCESRTHTAISRSAFTFTRPRSDRTGCIRQHEGDDPAYEELTGVKFPTTNTTRRSLPDSQFGGMENITATTMADTEIFLRRFRYSARRSSRISFRTSGTFMVRRSGDLQKLGGAMAERRLRDIYGSGLSRERCTAGGTIMSKGEIRRRTVF